FTVRVKAKKLYSLYAILRNKLSFARERMKTYYDKYRVEGPPLKEGDKVYLLRRYIRTRRPSNKLDFKKLGPFRVKRKVLVINYKLELPNSMRLRIYVFYILLLELVLDKTEIVVAFDAEDEE